MEIKGGCTRTVILIGQYAIKIPRLNYGWRLFLMGLLGNMQEVHFNTMKDDRMCPILFHLKGGWLLVMPRCKEISDNDYFHLKIDKFWAREPSFKVPVEHKISSFGWYKNKIVAIDYGS